MTGTKEHYNFFRLETRVFTEAVPDTICDREQAGKVSVDVFLSSVGKGNDNTVLDSLLKLSYMVIPVLQV